MAHWQVTFKSGEYSDTEVVMPSTKWDVLEFVLEQQVALKAMVEEKGPIIKIQRAF